MKDRRGCPKERKDGPIPDNLPPRSCPVLDIPDWFWRITSVQKRGNARTWLDRELAEAFENEYARATQPKDTNPGDASDRDFGFIDQQAKAARVARGR